jgi:hypothetical protein
MPTSWFRSLGGKRRSRTQGSKPENKSGSNLRRSFCTCMLPRFWATTRRKITQLILLSAFVCTSGFGGSTSVWSITEPNAQEPVNSCLNSRSTLLDIVPSDRDGQSFHVPIWQLPDSRVFYFTSAMAIDADGASNAYHPGDTELDEVANAGAPGRWNGIVADRERKPLIQKDSDPSPGYYISCTSLEDGTRRRQAARGT